MCMVLILEILVFFSKRFEVEHQACNKFDRSVVLIRSFVELRGLPQLSADAGIIADDSDRGRAGTTLVDQYLLGDSLKINGTPQIQMCREQTSLGSEKEIKSVGYPGNRAVGGISLVRDVDIGFAHLSTLADGSFTTQGNNSRHLQHLDFSSMQCGAIDKNTTLLQHFCRFKWTQQIDVVATQKGRRAIPQIVMTIERFVQCSIARTSTQIKYGVECCFTLLRQDWQMLLLVSA